MTAQMVRDIAAEAFADAIDICSIIETLEAGPKPIMVVFTGNSGSSSRNRP